MDIDVKILSKILLKGAMKEMCRFKLDLSKEFKVSSVSYKSSNVNSI